MRDYLILSPKELDRERLARLQKRMQNRKASICSQRALLYTESFQQTEQDPYILRKAKAFVHTLTHMDIYLEEDSMILEIRQVEILPHRFFLNILLIGSLMNWILLKNGKVMSLRLMTKLKQIFYPLRLIGIGILMKML